MKGRTRKQQIGIIAAMIVGVFAISVGFAAFSSTLSIRSSATVNPDASSFAVIFSKDGTSIDATQTVEASSETYGEDATITNGTSPVIGGLKAKFTAPGQSVSYSFYAKNTGSYDAYLNYITFLNAEGATSNKICTAGDGTDQTMVDSACNGISISVKVGNDEAVTTSQAGITNHMLGKGLNEPVVVTITYAENSAVADGVFDVSFGDISLIYSSISDYVIESTTVCTPVSVATTGNVPQGNYTAGDEYMCEVKDGTSYRFFVLNTEGDNVNLISEANINSNGEPIITDEMAQEDNGGVAWNENNVTNQGPVTAINYLNTATSTWGNIDNLNETYDDKGGNYNSFVLSGKARLPKYDEVVGTGCQESTFGSCPLWMINYSALNTGLYSEDGYLSFSLAYWTLDSAEGFEENSWYVTSDGLLFYDTPVNELYNVRPVIRVPKSQIG